MMHWYCKVTLKRSCSRIFSVCLFVRQIVWTRSDRPSTESPWNCWVCRNSVRVGDPILTAWMHLYHINAYFRGVCVYVTCVSALLCASFLVNVVFLGHITAAFVQGGGANLRFDTEEVTQTLSRMFHNVTEEVPGHRMAVERLCRLVFQLFDRCGHNKSRVLIWRFTILEASNALIIIFGFFSTLRNRSNSVSADCVQTLLIVLSAETLPVKYTGDCLRQSVFLCMCPSVCRSRWLSASACLCLCFRLPFRVKFGPSPSPPPFFSKYIIFVLFAALADLSGNGSGSVSRSGLTSLLDHLNQVPDVCSSLQGGLFCSCVLAAPLVNLA